MTAATTTTKTYEFIGSTDEVTTCECCGKSNLKKTVILRHIASGDYRFFGTVCASRALGNKNATPASAKKQVDALTMERQQFDATIKNMRAAISERGLSPRAYLQTEGYSLNDFRGPIYCTECGYTDGYSGSWDDRFSCEQKADGLAYSVGHLIETQPFLTGLHYWNIGSPPGSRWTNDEPCLPLMASAVQ